MIQSIPEADKKTVKTITMVEKSTTNSINIPKTMNETL